MAKTTSHGHGERMKALVEYTAGSLNTDFPSPFGSAIYEAASGVLVTQAFDTVLRMCDPTNHAEINAIRQATKALKRLSLSGHILYSTCQPCPMCMSACIWAEVETVVYGASTMDDANLYWPQASDVTPEELVSRMRFQPRSTVVANVERPLCQELFQRCDAVRKRGGLQLPPRR